MLKSLLFVALLLLTACASAPPAAAPVTTAAGMIEAIKAAGLEVADVQPVGELPDGAAEGLKFYTPSLCDGCSSMALIFESEAAALETKAMIDQAGEVNEAFKFWVYHDGRLLLRMGGLIDQAEAGKYAAALNLQ